MQRLHKACTGRPPFEHDVLGGHIGSAPPSAALAQATDGIFPNESICWRLDAVLGPVHGGRPAAAVEAE